MAFCTNCGLKLSEGANFCTECGVAVGVMLPNDNATRKITYDGEIHKCPNCGELLNAFVSNCPSCDYEIRGKNATNSVQLFYWEINKTTSAQQRDLLIRNFPIPNTKEDILEFLILTSSNALGEGEKFFFDAWVAKFEQCYQKALLLFVNDYDFAKIQQIYDEFHENVNNERNRRINKFAYDTLIRNIAIFIGVTMMIVAIFIDSSGHNPSMIHVVAGIVLISSASGLAKRDAPIIDFAIGAVNSVVMIGLSFFFDDDLGLNQFGVITLIIIVVNYFKSIRNKSKKWE